MSLVHVKDEYEYEELFEDVYCKEEPKSDDDVARLELYADHRVKDELVLGPELMYPPDKAHAAQVALALEGSRELSPEKPCKQEPSQVSMCLKQFELQDCVVRLERIPLSSLDNINIPEYAKDSRQRLSIANDDNKSKKFTNDINKEVNKTKIYICDTCNKMFTRRKPFLHHLRIHNKPYACDICKRKFTLQKYLRMHELVHTQRHFFCKVCNKKFTTQRNLKNHEFVIHEAEHLSCDVCSREFTWKASLIRHRLIHSGEKPYHCEICNMHFRYKDALAIHIRQHNGEMLYSCEICEKKFLSHSNLYRHKLIHTKKYGYACDKCGKKFLYAASLRNHENIHNREETFQYFQCDICEQKCTTKKGLIKHLSTHLKDRPRPFFCNKCSKKFLHKRTLTLHELTHTNEKPFACDICEKAFKCKDYLLRHHSEMHSGKKPLKSRKMEEVQVPPLGRYFFTDTGREDLLPNQ
ncbi:zinc finger protein 260-like [Cydia amplana]|uniref:zinc finger protein 260-like n=1 Tax=Cydia amplana TaxID=1869771 RepID=UPI002FE688E7